MREETRVPSLICSSRYTIDSQILRKAAQSLGWETLRLDGMQIPEWFNPPDDEIAIFFTAPHAFEIGRQLGRKLLGCSPDWLVNLPGELLRRQILQTTLQEALKINKPQFVKHALSKAFPASVYSSQTLAAATHSVHRDSLVHVGEPVEWECEFRCFIANREVVAVSPYRLDGLTITDNDSFPTVHPSELKTVCEFAETVIGHPEVRTPDAFVLDVGKIVARGWAAVEWNECWASGIYGCDPIRVLQSLTVGNIESDRADATWDFERHYRSACPNLTADFNNV